MATIGQNTIGSASRLLDALLKKHATEIDSAYLKAPESFKVDLGIKFKPADNGNIELEVSIAFVKERCKDSVKGQINENMDDLFAQKKRPEDKEEETVIEPDKVVMIDKGHSALAEGKE